MNIRALVAEVIGTFTLVFFGSLGVATYVISTQGQGGPIYVLLVVPFAFGLGLMAAIAIAGPASGGHFNPAVTLAVLLDGRMDWKNALGYAVAQLIGAFAASLATLVITSISIVAATVNQPGPTAEAQFDVELHAFAVEAVLTALFIAVILTVTRKAPGQAIIVIPLTLVAIHFVGIYVSGASVNPARSLAPAALSGTYTSLWVYLTGPFVGSILGWGIYRFLNPPDEEVDDETDEGDDEFDELAYTTEDDD
ncbi:MAG: aquaporin [Candidatus Limnocylindrales bacterium]